MIHIQILILDGTHEDDRQSDVIIIFHISTVFPYSGFSLQRFPLNGAHYNNKRFRNYADYCMVVQYDYH